MGITERIDAITGIGHKYRGHFLPAPKSVKLELNTRCNYQCTFCVRSVRDNESTDMDRAFFSRVIREMRDAGVEELGLFYINEPCDDSLAMADLTQVSFMDGWNSAAYQELRKAHLSGDVSKTACASCMS